MNKITFTSGTLENLGEFYTLTLFNGAAVVYTATVEEADACEYIIKYKNIKLK